MRKAITSGAVVILLAIIASFAAEGARIKSQALLCRKVVIFHQNSHVTGRATARLQITGVPSEAKSLVLIADDPGAPRRLFTHWLVWNIPPQTNSIAEGGALKGVHGTNDFGKSAYSGPCPPSVIHRYSFKIFALDRELDLSSGAKRSEMDAAIKGHVITQGELMGRYARK
jgi:Raf kinase inhibitor-like YbhB/YbcL family protein